MVTQDPERPAHERALLEAAKGYRPQHGRLPTEAPHGDACADEVLGAEVLRLKIRGRSSWSISRELRIPEPRVRELLRDSLAERRAERLALADVLIDIELGRCDDIINAHWDTAMDAPIGAFGKSYSAQEKSTRVVLLAMERRSKYLGLDAPEQKKHEVTGAGGAPLTAPPALQMLYQRASAGDESAIAALREFAVTGLLPSEGGREVVDGVAEVLPSDDGDPQASGLSASNEEAKPEEARHSPPAVTTAP